MAIISDSSRGSAVPVTSVPTSDTIEFEKFSKRILNLVNNSMQAEAYKNGEQNDFGFDVIDITPEDLTEIARLEKLGALMNLAPPTVSTGAILPPKAESVFEDARRELQKLKDEFGGSPNYGNSMPTKNYQNEGKIFGIWPKDAGRVWATAGLNKVKSGELPHIVEPFFKFVQKILGVDHEQSHFEYISLHLESMGKLEANSESIIGAFKKNANAAHRLGDATGWAYHVDHTTFGAAADFLELHLKIFSDLYIEHKEKGDLKEFFTAAFDPSLVCIDARHMRLQALWTERLFVPLEDPIDLKNTEFKSLISNLSSDVKKKYGLENDAPAPLSKVCDYLKEKFKKEGPIGLEGLFDGIRRTISEADLLDALNEAIEMDCTVVEDSEELLGNTTAAVDYFRQFQVVDSSIQLLKV